MLLLVLLLKLQQIIFTDIPLSLSEVCAGAYSSQHISIVGIWGGYLDRWDFSELFVQRGRIQLLPPWACLMRNQRSATSLFLLRTSERYRQI